MGTNLLAQASDLIPCEKEDGGSRSPVEKWNLFTAKEQKY